MFLKVYNPIPAPSNLFEKRSFHINSRGTKKRVLKYNRYAIAHRRGRVGTSAAAQVEETDVVVVGSGIGGLSAASLLAKYGVKVTVCESHSIPGGAAHAWVQDGYHFESGPSLYSGMTGRGPAANPIAHVLAAIGESPEMIEYKGWNVMLPEGTFYTEVGNAQFEEVLQAVAPTGIRDWQGLQRAMQPLARAAALLPPVALRSDPLVGITAGARYLPSLLQGGADALKLLGPFSNVMDQHVTDPFVRNWLDLLCFLLSGLTSKGTIAAEVAYMWAEWYRPNCHLEFPRGGSQALINALVRGLKKHSGALRLNAHVAQLLCERGRVTGVVLHDGKIVKARKGVVSNASMWDTQRLLPPELAAAFAPRTLDVPLNRSFMHLHLGFDGQGLENPGLHHIHVRDWRPGVDAEQNVVLVSIASAVDQGMAPPGKHTLHAYLPATEPFSLWEGLERDSPQYEELKRERSRVLYDTVEAIIPDIRERTEIEMVGTPLTHCRFLRRHRGTYGPGIVAGDQTFPGPKSPVPGLWCCGDSTFPGIGVPAVAASGLIVANSLVPFTQHWRLLDEIGV